MTAALIRLWRRDAQGVESLTTLRVVNPHGLTVAGVIRIRDRAVRACDGQVQSELFMPAPGAGGK